MPTFYLLKSTTAPTAVYLEQKPDMHCCICFNRDKPGFRADMQIFAGTVCGYAYFCWDSVRMYRFLLGQCPDMQIFVGTVCSFTVLLYNLAPLAISSFLILGNYVVLTAVRKDRITPPPSLPPPPPSLPLSPSSSPFPPLPLTPPHFPP